jgi:hypothetical protein
MNRYNIFFCILCIAFYSCERKNTSYSQTEDNIVVEDLSDTIVYNKNYFSNYSFFKVSEYSNISILMLNHKNDRIKVVSDDDFLIDPIRLSKEKDSIKFEKSYKNSRLSKIFFESSYINILNDTVNNSADEKRDGTFQNLKIKNALILDREIIVFDQIYIGINKQDFIKLIFNDDSNLFDKYNYFDIYYVIDDEYPNISFEFSDDILNKILIGKIEE